MRTHSLRPSEGPHALKRENVYLFSAMHLPDFQIWAHQCSPYVPHIGWESQKLIAIFRKSSPPLSRCCTNLKARKFAIPCFWLLLIVVAKWTPAISLEAAQPCSAKLLVPANKRWSCGKDLAGQGKREPQHLPAVSSGRVESSVPNWERCALHGLWTRSVYLCCLLKGTLCRLRRAVHRWLQSCSPQGGERDRSGHAD